MSAAAGAPSAAELLARARELVPLVKARAAATERERMVSREVMQAVRATSIFRSCRPRRFGGFEHDPELIYDITVMLATACASTAWCVVVATVGDWMLGAFPLRAQQDVWEANPDALLCASFAPTAKGVPCDGGFIVSGKWGFASGCDHAQWAMLGTVIAPEGKPPAPAFLLLPAADYALEDNWFTSGLSGTGSKNLTARDVFVPQHRIVTFAEMTSGDNPGSKVHDNPIFGIPFMAVFPGMLAATGVGAAKGAVEDFIATVQVRETRGAVAGGLKRMADFATIQLRLAEASASAAAAELILRTDMREVAATVHGGSKPDVPNRIRYRRNQAFAAKLAVAAVEALNGATGGNGLFLDHPVQRAWRDANAVARHIGVNWDAVGTMFGQHALGLEPFGQY